MTTFEEQLASAVSDAHECKGHVHTSYIRYLLRNEVTKHFMSIAMIDEKTDERFLLGPYVEEGDILNPVEVVIKTLRCCDDMALVQTFNGETWWTSTLDLWPEFSPKEKSK